MRFSESPKVSYVTTKSNQKVYPETKVKVIFKKNVEVERQKKFS